MKFSAGFFLLLALALLTSHDRRRSVNAPLVKLYPGDDIQLSVSEYPPGTTFLLADGTYRLQQVKPKDSDVFIGGGAGTVLTGAVLLNSFEKIGKVYLAKYSPQNGQVHGECNADRPMCKYPEDCFIDDKPLRRVASLAEVKSGTWLLDAASGLVIIGDDPSGKIVEVSTARCAFSGTSSHVEISNLTVEKYAIPAQMGAIGDQYPAKAWSIYHCTIRLNHGAGVSATDDSRIDGNQIVMNGQLGVSGHGTNLAVSNNEIAFNNFAGFSMAWEAGGTKFSRTTNLSAKGNIVHDNMGAGLWTDIDNRNVSYQSNRVFNNCGEGIKHEISFSAIVADNTLWGNGKCQSVWLWGSQILLQNSSGADVSDNKVFVPQDFGNGITVVLQRRAGYIAVDNVVHDNDVTYLGDKGTTGSACDYDSLSPLLLRNHFDRNHYHVRKSDDAHWSWAGKLIKWDAFIRAGNEPHGTIDNRADVP